MEILKRTLQIHESDSPRAALQALASAPPVRAAAWLTAGEVVEAWPDGAFGAERDEPRLVLPLPGEGEALALLLEPGTEVEEVAEWAPLASAFERLLRRERGRSAMEEETAALRKRAEESEALHVLGLAANRSLDPDEVLDLVSRFTRTLLGAHYVTVSTREENEIRTVAAVGLRAPEEFPRDDPFAASVIARGKPVVVDAARDGLAEGYHFHSGQGMVTGLGVPLSLYGGTFGALVIGYRRPFPLAARDTRLALTLAGHAAVAISNARLHRDLAERSRELERAYEELRWTAQAKERFFASMSHELRTPLNAILGFQSLLLEGIAGTMPDMQRGFVERAQGATQALLLLVNDVLDLSKIEAGKMELYLRPVRLSDVVAEAVQIIHPMAAAKGIRVRTPPPDQLATALRTDADRVRQILLNLLSNAVKFTEGGSVEVRAESVPPRASEGEGWVEIRVVDTGPGIDPDSHERIFHEFEQIAGDNVRGGTGLGLPISRKLARLLGGDLRVESQPGAGAAFILRLPGAAAPESGTPVAQEGTPRQ